MQTNASKNSVPTYVADDNKHSVHANDDLLAYEKSVDITMALRALAQSARDGLHRTE